MTIPTVLSNQQQLCLWQKGYQGHAEASLQMGSGHKIKRPADCPDQITTLLTVQAHQTNAEHALDRNVKVDLVLKEYALKHKQICDVLSDCLVATTSANNSAIGDNAGWQRDVKTCQNQLISLLNSQDPLNEQYMFGGGIGDTPYRLEKAQF